MNTYRIAPAEDGFQVIEILPNHCDTVVNGFPTEADAQGWVDSLAHLLRLIGGMTDRPSRT